MLPVFLIRKNAASISKAAVPKPKSCCWLHTFINIGSEIRRNIMRYIGKWTLEPLLVNIIQNIHEGPHSMGQYPIAAKGAACGILVLYTLAAFFSYKVDLKLIPVLGSKKLDGAIRIICIPVSIIVDFLLIRRFWYTSVLAAPLFGYITNYWWCHTWTQSDEIKTYHQQDISVFAFVTFCFFLCDLVFWICGIDF